MSKESQLSFKVEYPKADFGSLGTGQDGIGISHLRYQDLESQGQEETIVVVLFGWTGATDKQLSKYSDIYLERGCIVVRCLYPVKVVIYDQGKLPMLANRFVDLLRKHRLQSHPTFLHAFSNCGAYLYSYVLKEIASQKNPAEFNIRGTIFDSAPFWPTIKSGYAAIGTVLNSYTRYTFGLATLLTAILVIHVVVRMFFVYLRLAWETTISGTFQRPGPIDQKIEKFPLYDFQTRIWKLRNHSFAFLYSQTDDITPSQEVEEIAGAILDRGNPVRLVKFDGSGHVLHYRMYPKEYVLAVTRFIEETMESYSGPSVYWDEYN